MSTTCTLTGCKALLGESATLSEGLVDIVISGTKIARISAAGTRPAEGEVIDASNRLVVPGMVNGHHHSHENFHKGRYDNLPLELWMNFVRPLKPLPVTPRQVYLRTMISAMEALRTGATTIVDDLNVSPRLDPALVEAAYQAYEDVGIRAYVGITLFDKPFFRGVPFVDEELPADLLAELDSTSSTSAEEILGFARSLATKHHPDSNRVAYIAAPSAPQRCTEPFLLAVRAMADELRVPLMIHVQETRMQVITGYEFYGSTMIEYLDRIGFLKAGTTVIHGVWVTPAELDILGRAGVTVQHNPCSNFKLGSGLMPMRAMLDAGVNISLGSDGCGSIEGVDMLRVLYNTALAQKLRGDDHTRWIGAREAWRAATLGGAQGLGREDLGAIDVGRTADLALYRLDDIAFTPLNNPINQLVYAQTGRGLDSVFVDGRQVMRGGQLTQVDEAALIAEIQEAHSELEPHITLSENTVGRLREAYTRIYERCKAMDIPDATIQARFP
ncbi:amidohydrolase family protein [Allohahella marinimesophila]|uniref:Amidohydrolase family protein n=1 Tax=Allohahella marinimesophila TaxID=1054972 RepID=A0ABP7NKD9_9GAMM